MDFHIPYSNPARDDICVAFCFFNPCGYVRPLQNTVLFQEKLRLANIPYYSIEMSIAGKPPMLASPTLRVKSNSCLFYKEALWNRIEKEIPPQYTKIAFLDSDVIFSDANWLDRLSILLDSCDLVHPFQTVDRLNLAYEKVDTLTSSIKETNYIGSGMGWAITRETFHALGGFFDKGILGNGDTLFFNCMQPKVNINEGHYYLIQDSYMAYRKNYQSVNPRVTYLDCHIYHLSHGTLKNRQYGSRHNEILGPINQGWDSLFSLNSEGFWELTDISLNKKMIDYFISRKEDSQDIDVTREQIKVVSRSNLIQAPRPILIKQINQGHDTKSKDKVANDRLSKEPLKNQTIIQPNKDMNGKVFVPQRIHTLVKPVLPISPVSQTRLPVSTQLKLLQIKRN